MGSDWSWSLYLTPGSLTVDAVEALLALAEAAGLSPQRPDGAFNGFHNHLEYSRPEDFHRLLDRQELLTGLATGSYTTNLWTPSQVDVHLSTVPGDATTPARLRLALDSCHTWRSPVAAADSFRRLHRQLTELWLAAAETFDAIFGRVEDEWSLEQIWHLLGTTYPDGPPPPGRWPELMGWWTYLNAEYYRRLPPLPPDAEATVHHTSAGVVIALLDDPASVDELAYERLHVRLLTGLPPGQQLQR